MKLKIHYKEGWERTLDELQRWQQAANTVIFVRAFTLNVA